MKETWMEDEGNNEEGKIISRIKGIKRKLLINGFLSGEELKKEITEAFKEEWNGIEDLYEDDLREIGAFHSFLIGEVVKLHKNEESQVNNTLIKDNLNARRIMESVEDGKLSSRIYFFNEESYEYFYVGDIHSDDFIVDCILEKVEFFSKILENRKIRLIFLGDYVDRGKNHLKTIEKIMSLKYIFPGNIFLLMGNHDAGKIENDVVGLYVKKPEEDKPEDYFFLYLDGLTKRNSSYGRELISKYISLFNSMAVISFLKCDGKCICGVHGGIPRPLREEKALFGYIKTLKDLTDEDKVNNRDETIINNMLWSDPLGDREDVRNHTRRFGFTEEEFKLYAEIIGIDYLIRGHEANEAGVRTFFEDKLYCIFGSGRVMLKDKDVNLSTAYNWVSPKLLKVKKHEGLELVDLSEITQTKL